MRSRAVVTKSLRLGTWEKTRTRMGRTREQHGSVPGFQRAKELNARRDEPVEAVVVRSGQEPIVVNLDITSPDDAEENGREVPFHPAPSR